MVKHLSYATNSRNSLRKTRSHTLEILKGAADQLTQHAFSSGGNAQQDKAASGMPIPTQELAFLQSADELGNILTIGEHSPACLWNAYGSSSAGASDDQHQIIFFSLQSKVVGGTLPAAPK
jgi:hypothetical protein